MSDPFDDLGISRELGVSIEVIEEAFRAKSRQVHPDMGGSVGEFERIKDSANILKDPSRLLRWALESGGNSWDARGRVPMSVMDLFSPIAEVLQKVDCLIAEREGSRSALGRALIDGRVPGLKGEVEGLLERLGEEEERLISNLPRFDRVGWMESHEEMAELARGLAFTSKWQGQLRGATGKLFQALLNG